MEFLTEQEVAVLLRCSREKIKRLRLSGALGYLPGRPPLILRDDLNAYIEAIRLEAVKRRGPEPGSPEAQEEMMERARQRARTAWFKRKMREQFKR